MTEHREKEPYLKLSPSIGETEEEITTVHQDSLHQISAASHLAEPPAAAAAAAKEEEDGDDNSSDDFEFTFAARDPEAETSITADEIFSNGRILPSYPVFGSNFLISPAAEMERSSTSSDSSEADAAVGAYCAWSRPSAGQCKKSASTGSARRWRLRDLMVGRSHSDGKEKFVFLAADDKTHKAASASATATKKGEKKGARATELDLVTAHRLYYAKGDAEKAKGGRRSFLPYRPVGLFGNVNGFGR
ncbi:uncharacterized protein LOC120113340 [Phoenix dactylifera]|uniref:Uncharacterized protein LOC103705856 n=1 Tax=Phoenix dactylifera TaxID=42345 RepID=A0A8B9B3J4_PHODC|nr:uncharacterized protein LOC103705856 [Phoenix dactylifera]XP_038990424.1 uncharacterized protein LOC120113340 [Phoenix dactylifera]